MKVSDMELVYYPHRSEIVEYFFLPITVQSQKEFDREDWSPKERALLKDALLIQEQLELAFEDMAETFQASYLLGRGFGFLHFLYFEILEQGNDPQTLDEACRAIAQLSRKEIERVIRFALLGMVDDAEQAEGDLFALLEQTHAKPAQKWQWGQAIRHPHKTVEQQLTLIKEAADRYQPYYQAFKEQRDVFAQTFSLDSLYGENGLYKTSGLENLSFRELQFFVLSPWLVHFSFFYNREYQTSPLILCASVGIESLLVAKQSIDEEVLASTLKMISDETRYRVMVELSKPHAKSKEIAENLGITGAAVSFHTQKLINAQLLLFNTEDKHVKFDVNKRLLREILAKLQEDFGL